MSEPIVVKTDQIPSSSIDPEALKVIRRLKRYDHTAYLVGGCVRDLLNGLKPKDFDVITSARPRQVRKLFSNSRVIGRRFRLVHVIFGSNVIEVSTFRADPKQFTDDESGAGAITDIGTVEDPDASDVASLDSQIGEVADEDEDDEAEDVEAEDEDDEAEDVEAEDDDDEAEDEDEAEAEVEDEAEAGDDEPPLTLDLDSDDDSEDVEIPGDDEPAPPQRARVDFDLNNMFGEPDEDARRRDFTINALFYDPDRHEIIDHVGGLADSERKLVNPINDPMEAFAEDPVRMIRAVRFASKLGFTIEEARARAMDAQRHLIEECSQRRLLEEVFKILSGGYARGLRQDADRHRTRQRVPP